MKGFEDNKSLLNALEVLEDNLMACLKQVVFKLWLWNEGNEKKIDEGEKKKTK
jgi:hypothetical protein